METEKLGAFDGRLKMTDERVAFFSGSGSDVESHCGSPERKWKMAPASRDDESETPRKVRSFG